MSAISFKMNTSPAQVFYGIGGLMVLAGIASSYLYFVPALRTAWADALTSRTHYESLKRDTDNLRQIQVQLGQGKQRLAAIGVTPQLLSSIVPDTEDMPGLYLQMEEFAARTGPGRAKVTYQLSDPVAAPDGVRIGVTLTAKGSYSQIKVALAEAETLQRPITITAISLNADQSTFIPATDTAGKQYAAPQTSLSASGFILAKALSPAYAK